MINSGAPLTDSIRLEIDAANDRPDRKRSSDWQGESLLVLLWGEGDEGGDEDTETLMDLADTEGIHVVDLTAGMDDMVFTEEEPVVIPEPEPEPAPRRGRRAAAAAAAAEPEPEAEKPARRGRARKAEEPLVQEEVPLTDETPAEPVKPARKSRKKAEPEATTEGATADYHERLATAKSAAEPEPADEADDIISNGVIAARPPVFESMDLIKGTLSAVWLYLQSETENDALLMLDETVEESPLAMAVREALEALEGVATLSAEAHLGEPKRGRGRPRREPSEDDTTPYLQDADGILRTAGRGRPRRGETRVELTAAEFDAKVKAGLFEDEG